MVTYHHNIGFHISSLVAHIFPA